MIGKLQNTDKKYLQILELAGTKTDSAVALETGAPYALVYRIRIKHSIPAFRRATNTVNVGKEEQEDRDLLNWERSDELAESIDQIMAKKRKLAQNRRCA